MMHPLSYIKNKISPEEWDNLRRKSLLNLVRRYNDICERNLPESSFGEVVTLYQRFRRLNNEVIESYLDKKMVDDALANMKSIIDQIPKDRFSLFLHPEEIMSGIKDFKHSLHMLVNSNVLNFVNLEEQPVADYVMECATKQYKSPPITTMKEARERLTCYVHDKIRDDYMDFLDKLESYGLILAYMQANNLEGSNKDDWDIFWSGVDLLNHPLAVSIIKDSFSAAVSTFREDLYEVDKVLDHVTYSLFNPILQDVRNRFFTTERIYNLLAFIFGTEVSTKTKESTKQFMESFQYDPDENSTSNNNDEDKEDSKDDEDDEDNEGEEWKNGSDSV